MTCFRCLRVKPSRQRAAYQPNNLGVLEKSGNSTNTVDQVSLPTGVCKRYRARTFTLCKEQTLFTGMDEDHMHHMCAKAKVVRFKHSSIVIAQGDSISDRSCMYIVDTGAVTVHIYGSKPFDLDLGPGQMFGEVALLFKTTRNATVVSKDCKLVAISQPLLSRFLCAMPAARTILFMRAHMLLQNLSDTELFDFVRQVHIARFYEGEVLIEEGTPGHTMYIIRSGQVAVLRAGREVARLSRSDVLGQRALHGKPRTATCLAASAVEAVVIDDHVMDRLSNPMLRKILCCDAVVAVQQHSRVFGSFDQYQMETLLRTIEETVFGLGHTVIRKGDPMTDLWVVRDGRTVGDAVAEAGGFQYFGSITGHPCPSDVTVCTDTASIVKCSKEGWMKILQRNLTDATRVVMKDLEVGHELGAGTSGRVCLARQRTHPTRLYAVKSIPKAPNTYRNAMQEGVIMRSINNYFCVRLFNVEEDDNHIHIVMEHVPGGELFKKLQQHSKFTEGYARFCFGCVVLALDYLHRNGIVYRDLKPENLLIDGRGYVKMTDFGFAKRIGNARTYTICGTPEYQAPEIMQDTGATMASDYWSLGVLAYEMLTGVSPFVPHSPRPHELVSNPWRIIHNARAGRYLPPPGYQGSPVHDIITRLLQPNPALRLRSTHEIKAHPWFEGFDWRALSEQRLTPPKR